LFMSTEKRFTLGGWVAMASPDAIKIGIDLTIAYRAVLFRREEDRDAFYDLSVEMFPYETFIKSTISGKPAIQNRNK